MVPGAAAVDLPEVPDRRIVALGGPITSSSSASAKREPLFTELQSYGASHEMLADSPFSAEDLFNARKET